MTDKEAGPHPWINAYRQMRIVVTGGAGFLGSNLVKKLINVADHITIVDDLFTGSKSEVPDKSQVTFIQSSITDSYVMDHVLANCDVLFHFAARNITLSVDQPLTDFQVNAEGTLKLLISMLRHHRIKRMVYASTSSIYGNSPQLPALENGYDLSVPYAASKMCGELLCMTYHRTYDLPITALRFSNVYGPGQVSTNPYCGVVSKFLERYVQGKPLQIFGDGTQTRDFTYVDDAMNAVLCAGLHDRTNGQVFNVGTAVETSVNDLAHQLRLVLGELNYEISYKPKRVIDTVHRRVVAIDKLVNATGWRPEISLQNGLKRTWEWYRQLSMERSESQR